MRTDEGPILIAQAGQFDGKHWVLQRTLLLGRGGDCDIVIDNRQVSRHHARLTATTDGILLEDLGSKNGTHCNGKLVVDPLLLQDGDVIQIALAQQFVYLSSDATMPLDGEIDFSAFRPAPGGHAGLHLEKRSRRVWVRSQEVLPPLSVSQFNLLEALIDQEGQVVSRADVIRAVWGQDHAIEVSDQALDALVRRLRDRLAETDPDHNYIVTVRGHGLRLENL
jgi:hypothetical protein